MSLEQTDELIEKIRMHRPSFLGHLDKSGISKIKVEWHRILEPYSYVDVEKKLDEYFRDSENFGKYPDAYYLCRFLKTEEEKSHFVDISVRCQICNELVDYTEYDNHYSRCLSVDYIVRKRKQFFDKETDRKKLMSMNEKDFEKNYKTFIEKIHELTTSKIEKYNLQCMIKSFNNEPVEFDIKKSLGGYYD